MIRILLLFAAIAQAQPASRLLAGPAEEMTRKINHRPIGLSFPPVASPAEISSTIQHAQALGVTSIRFAENWKLRETAENTWNWAGLDYRIDSLHNAGIKIFLTIESDGPAWRCGVKNARSCVYTDLQAFRVYVDALVRRYAGKLAYIQFGNEVFEPYWYAGTGSEFVTTANAFYEAVKAADPNLPVVLAGVQISAVHALAVCQASRPIPTRNSQGAITPATTWCAEANNQEALRRFALITAGARYDLVDVHLYDNMEYWFDYLEVIRGLLPGKSLVSTELGAPSKRYEPQDDAYHAARVGRMLAMVPFLGLHEAFYFKLVEYPATQDAEHEKSGLIGHPEMDLKPAYQVFQSFNVGGQ